MKNTTQKFDGKTCEMTYADAIRDALDIALARDPLTFAIGEGIPDPKGAFGTTTGLAAKHGPYRIMDMPVSENGLTGVAIGAALAGMRPILTHMRIDFALLSLDQIINNAAKWYYMYGGQVSVPIVIRMIIGRGWGQGPQHSQSLQVLFAHIPGLKVVMPATASDAKGLLLSAIADPNPVIYIEHRWLHKVTGPVLSGYVETPIGSARVIEKGTDVTIVSSSYMTVECLKAHGILKKAGIRAEVVDLRSIKPIDWTTLEASVGKTKRLLVADTGHTSFGVSAEILAHVAEKGISLLAPPVRVASPDLPVPTAKQLAEAYYPTAKTIVLKTLQLMGLRKEQIDGIICDIKDTPNVSSDQPDPTFIGPF